MESRWLWRTLRARSWLARPVVREAAFEDLDYGRWSYVIYLPTATDVTLQAGEPQCSVPASRCEENLFVGG